MAMKKYTKGEGSLEILRGREALALNQHFQRTGKFAISEFSSEERAALDADLEEARKLDLKENPPAKKEAE